MLRVQRHEEEKLSNLHTKHELPFEREKSQQENERIEAKLCKLNCSRTCHKQTP